MSPFDPTPLPNDEGHYFTIEELRAQSPELASVTKFTTELLESKRQEAEEDFEALAHRAFMSRTATYAAHGGAKHLLLPYKDLVSVTGVTLEGAAVDITSVTVDPVLRALVHPGLWPEGVLYATVTYGMAEPPVAVKRAVMLLAKMYALPTSIDPRATAVINSDTGGYRISVATKDGHTGVPDVDAAAARWGDNEPAVG